MEYNIKITGRGNAEDLAKALRRLADAIHHPTSKGDGMNIPMDEIDGTEWGHHCELTIKTKEQ